MKKNTTYKVQQNHNGGAWKTLYTEFDNKVEAEIYYKGTCAFNGYKCRLVQGRKVLAQKGE